MFVAGSPHDPDRRIIWKSLFRHGYASREEGATFFYRLISLQAGN